MGPTIASDAPGATRIKPWQTNHPHGRHAVTLFLHLIAEALDIGTRSTHDSAVAAAQYTKQAGDKNNRHECFHRRSFAASPSGVMSDASLRARTSVVSAVTQLEHSTDVVAVGISTPFPPSHPPAAVPRKHFLA